MKNKWILFAVLLAFMPVLAGARAGMDFTLDTGEAKLCSCSTVQITGTLKSDVAGTYSISSDSKWITTAPDTITLSAGESAQVYAYLTTDCTSSPKDYAITVTVKSDAGISVSRQIAATILPCHNVAVLVSPAEARACLGESAQFSVKATNNGKAPEDFIISTTKGAIDAEKITLARNETKAMALTVPVKDTMQDATILIRSSSTYATDFKTVKISGINCYSSELSTAPQENSACLGDTANYTIALKNTGMRDDIMQVNSSFGRLTANEISVKAGETKNIILSASSTKEGAYPFSITASSRHTKAETQGIFNAKQCRGVEMAVAPQEHVVCKGYDANYSVQIKNTGLIDDTYVLSSSHGTLEKENITVKNGSHPIIRLMVPGSGLKDANNVKLRVTSIGDSGIAADADTVLHTENCYRLNSSVSIPEKSVCAGKTAVFDVEVTNAGKLPDDYTLNTALGGISSRYLTLKPEEKANISVTIPTERNDSGKKKINVTIISGNANATQELSLDINSADMCYGFRAAVKNGTLYANDSAGKLFEVAVKNTGLQSSNFSASIDGPSWAYASPKQFILQSGKNATIYIYAAPSFGTKDDAYLMKLSVKNDAGLAETAYMQLVLGNATALDLNKFRTAPAGKAVKTAPSAKSLYVIVLGIIIIAIIIFGPGLFRKKEEEEKQEYPEIKQEMPEELIGADKIATMDMQEGAKMDEPTEEKESEKKPAKRKKPKTAKKELQDILDNV